VAFNDVDEIITLGRRRVSGLEAVPRPVIQHTVATSDVLIASDDQATTMTDTGMAVHTAQRRQMHAHTSQLCCCCCCCF